MATSVPACDFTVGWVCALPIELAAAIRMMDEEFANLPSHPTDSNIYTFGRIGNHNVVAACLPAGQMGTNSAATVASQMRTSFPLLRFGLLVGIGGGVPNPSADIDIRLGDVVISQPAGQYGGVIQYDFGKTGADGRITRTGSLNAPPTTLLNALAKLHTNKLLRQTQVFTYLTDLSSDPLFTSPGPEQDTLYDPASPHIGMATCAKCRIEDIIERDERSNTDPELFFGNIASGNQVMKDGQTRDRYIQELGGVLCFEMEAAGLMNNFPCVVIKGICDYADAHKNKRWQPYAAATAAAYAKELLNTIPVEITKTEIPKNIDEHSFEKGHSKIVQACMRSLAFEEIDGRQNGIEAAATGTCEWLLKHKTLTEWTRQHRGLLWIKGKPGSGKSTLMKYALERVPTLYEPQPLVLSFFFHGRGHELQKSLLGLFRSILYQLLNVAPSALSDLIDNFDRKRETIGEPGKQWQWHLPEIQDLLKSSLSRILKTRGVLFFIDALDECGEEPAVQLIEHFKRLLSNVLSSEAFQLSICFSCRHYPVVELDGGSTILLDVENNTDIDIYVRARLPAGQDSHYQSLLTDRAQGVFMWARIVVDRVLQLKRRGLSKTRITGEIERTPARLDDLYNELLQHLDDRTGTIRLIQWVCFSARPLTTDELPWAMAIDSQNSDQSLDDCKESEGFISQEDIIRRITALSCGLVEVAPFSGASVIQFIHQSVKDYFVEQGLLLLDSSLEARGLVAPTFHYKLLLDCVSYLKMAISSQAEHFRKKDVVQFPFLNYSTTSLVLHMRLGELSESHATRIVYSLRWPSTSLDQWVSAYEAVEQWSWNRPAKGSTLIHIASIFNMQKILSRTLLDISSTEVNKKDGSCRTPLLYAARNGHETIVKMLLDTGKVEVNSKDNNSQTALSYAVQNGHKAIVKMLLDINKIDVDIKDIPYSRTPLLHAAEKGHEAIVKMLLDTGKVDVNSKDNSSRTPLSKAAERGHKAIVKILLDIGKVDLNSEDNSSRTPLLHAAENGHEAIVKMLLDTGKVDIDLKHLLYGRTPLLHAAEKGYEAIVKMLLDTGKVDVNSQDNSSRTPLLHAAENGHEAIVKVLLDTDKVDVNLKDNSSQTPLSKAAERGHEAIVKMLLDIDKVDVNLKDNSSQTPLSKAAERGHGAITKMLLDASKFDTNLRDNNGRTLLSYAIKTWSEVVIKMLLDLGRVDINSKCDDGQSLLSLAAWNGRGVVVKMLLDTGKFDLNSEDDHGRTPLSYAAWKGHKTVLKMLLDTGKTEVDSKSNNERTPLSYAAWNGHEAIVRMLLNTDEVNVNSKDTIYGQTPLSWSAENGHEAVVSMLLGNWKVDVDSRSKAGRTPLSFAAGVGNEAIVKLLLATKKTDINSCDNAGRTPLSWAARKGCKKVVSLLVNHYGTDINAEDDTGYSPLMWAVWKAHKEVVGILLRSGRLLHSGCMDGLCYQAFWFMLPAEVDAFVADIGYDIGDDFFGLKELFHEV